MQNKRTKLSIIVFLIVASMSIALPLQITQAQTTTVNVSPQSNAPQISQTFTVSIEISNVQNLYAIEITLNWNPAILQFVNAVLSLDAKAHSGGVLYGSPVSSVATNGGILLQTNTATQSTGEYDLVATSENPADSFNGTGTIVTLTFSASSEGYSPLTLTTSLADRPAPGNVAEFITHNDVSGSVNVGSNSASPSPSAPSSSSSSPTPQVPETPLTIMLTAVVFSASIAILLSRKTLRKHYSNSAKMPS